MKHFKYILILLAAALLMSFYYNYTQLVHRAHYKEYLQHRQITFIECDKCAIEISEIKLNTK